MYICLYVCVYVRMYVCMYNTCMHVCMHVSDWLKIDKLSINVTKRKVLSYISRKIKSAYQIFTWIPLP